MTCPTPCDPGCGESCHEAHQPQHKLGHQPDECPPARRHLVLEILWTEGGIPRTELFGPWDVQPDDSHLQQAWDFLAAWRERTGQVAERAVISLLTGPDAWAGQ